MKKFYFLLILGLLLHATISPKSEDEDNATEASNEGEKSEAEDPKKAKDEPKKAADPATSENETNKIVSEGQGTVTEQPQIQTETAVAVVTPVVVPVVMPPNGDPNHKLAMPPAPNQADKPKVEVTINIVAQALKELEKRLYYIEDKTDHILYHNNHDVTKHTVLMTPLGPQIVPQVENPASAHNQLKMHDVAKGSLAVNNMAMNQMMPQATNGGGQSMGGPGMGMGMAPPGMMGNFPGGGFGMGMGAGGFPNPGVMGQGQGMLPGGSMVKQARKIV